MYMTVADLIERYMSSFDETVALVYLLRCSGAWLPPSDGEAAQAARAREEEEEEASCARTTCLRDLRAQLAAEIASSEEHKEARSKLSDEIAELRLQQLEAEKKRSASLPSPGASPEEESVKQLKKSLNEAKEELEAAHRANRAKEVIAAECLPECLPECFPN